LSARLPTETYSWLATSEFVDSSPLSWLSFAPPISFADLALQTLSEGNMTSDRIAPRTPLVNDWFRAALSHSGKIPCLGCWPLRLHSSDDVHIIELSQTSEVRPDCRDEESRLYIVRCRRCAQQFRGLVCKGQPCRAIPPLPEGGGWSPAGPRHRVVEHDESIENSADGSGRRQSCDVRT